MAATGLVDEVSTDTYRATLEALTAHPTRHSFSAAYRDAARTVSDRFAALGYGTREEPVMQVGPNQGVQNTVVYLAEVPKGKAWPTAKPPEIDNVKCRFMPAIQVIGAGKLDVVNTDPVLHNTHGYYGKRTAFNLALPNQGQRIPVELPRAGVVRVDCDAHGWMEGWIYVAENPYYAVTSADGKFSITDVPPGSYKLVAFQPFIGPIEQSVTVRAGKPMPLTIELKKP